MSVDKAASERGDGRPDVMIDPDTGARLRRDVRPDVVRYRGLSVTIQQPGWWPEVDGVGEAVFVGEDNEVWSAALNELKRRLGEDHDHSPPLKGAAE